MTIFVIIAGSIVAWISAAIWTARGWIRLDDTFDADDAMDAAFAGLLSLLLWPIILLAYFVGRLIRGPEKPADWQEPKP